MRVAAGAVARKVLGDEILIRACVVQIGALPVDRTRFDWAERFANPFWAPDAAIVPVWEEALDAARRAGSSLGAIVEVQAEGVPAGWGAPVYGKLDSELASALMSINAVKGVEIGAGFAAVALDGREAGDEMRRGEEGAPVFLSNHAGGVLGGISTGQAVVARIALKPTSSISTPRRSLDSSGGRSRSPPTVATIPASASAPRLWRRRWSPAYWPTPSCAIAARQDADSTPPGRSSRHGRLDP